MTNQKGVTLVELLVTIVIIGIIIVPLLQFMTGTYTRTLSQEKETEIAYIAQETMEKVRLNDEEHALPIGNYCWSTITSACNGIPSLPAYYETNTDESIVVKVSVSSHDESDPSVFNEVKVTVTNSTKISYGDEPIDKQNIIELVTVVEK